MFMRVDGAVNQIRTGDLFLTKEVLCRLSYNSIFNFNAIISEQRKDTIFTIETHIHTAITKEVLCLLSYISKLKMAT